MQMGRIRGWDNDLHCTPSIGLWLDRSLLSESSALMGETELTCIAEILCRRWGGEGEGEGEVKVRRIELIFFSVISLLGLEEARVKYHSSWFLL